MSTNAATADPIGSAIERAVRDLLEKDDRTSPEDAPDMLLITGDELRSYLLDVSAVAVEAANERANRLRWALSHALKVADEAEREWDAAPSGMKAGKLLLALCGHLKKYRPDISAIHDILADNPTTTWPVPLPIETAPKDKPILAWMWGRWRVARWDDDRFNTKPRPCWNSDGIKISDSRAHQPEWWLPIPADVSPLPATTEELS